MLLLTEVGEVVYLWFSHVWSSLPSWQGKPVMGNGRLEASGRRFAGFFRYRLTTSHTPPLGVSEELAAQNMDDKIV